MAASERTLFWKTRLQPFRAIVVSIWTTLSLQKSLRTSFGTYAAVFLLLLGCTLLDGTFVHQFGLLLLLTALCYALLVAGLRSGGLGHSLTCDQEADLQDVCVHLAALELLVLGLVTGIVRLRAQKPVTFYVSGMLLVFLLGRLGMWLNFYALLWTAAAMLLAMPAALSRGWMSETTLGKVKETANDTAAIVQAFIVRHTRN